MRIGLIFVFCFVIALLSGLQINGDINQSSTWSEDVYINSDVLISGTAVITIDPGVNVIFTGGYHIEINDEVRILAGGEGAPVRFTADWDNDNVFGEEGLDNEHWQGLRVQYMDNAADSSHFENCIFEYSHKDGSENGYSNRYGGAIFIDHHNKVEFKNCEFRNNSIEGPSQAKGGAVYLIWSSPIFKDCYFNNNSTNVTNPFQANGGAVYGERAYFDMINCRFTNNLAEDEGGALYLKQSDWATFNNVILDSNNANEGGAVYLYDADVIMVNCTITGNTSVYAGAIYNKYSDPMIGNTIIWGNTASFRGDQIYNEMSEPEFNSCLVEGNDSAFYNDDSDGYVYDAGCIDVDPQFDNSNPNTPYMLSVDSPAIDSGADLWYAYLCDYDYLHNARVVNGAVDMGVYEIRGSVALQQTVMHFGDVVVDEPETLGCYLINDGNNVVVINSFSSDNDVFTTLNNDIEIPAEDSIFVEVSFNPEGMNSYVGELTISTDAGDFRITMDGAGLQRIIQNSMGMVNFNCLLGEERVIDLRISNDGNTPLEITEMNINSPNFTIMDNLPITIDAGGFVEVNCLYIPQNLGNEQVTVTVVSNAHNHPSFDMNISGIGDKLLTPGNVTITTNEDVIELNWDEVEFTQYGYSIDNITYLIDISATPSFDQYERINSNNNSHQYIPGVDVKKAWFRVIAQHISN